MRTPIPETRAAEPHRAFATVAVFTSFSAIAIAAVYWISRIGFANPAAPVVRSAMLAVFLATAPYAARSALRRRHLSGGRSLAGTKQRDAGNGQGEPANVDRSTGSEHFVPGAGQGSSYGWATSYSFLWLLTLAVTAVAGRAVPLLGVNLFPLLGTIGVVSLVVIVARWVMQGPKLASFAVIATSIGFGAWAAGVVWGRIYKSPLFAEMMALDGIVHHDAIGLAALGNMLRTYGVASVGLDGLPYMPYHWGSSWLFAQMANLLDMSVLDFYQLGYPVTMIPFFLGGILGFATEVRGLTREHDVRWQDMRSDFVAWVVLLVATIGVIPMAAMDALGVWTSNLVISESYAVAIPCALLLLGTTMVYWKEVGPDPLAAQNRISALVFPCLVLPAGIILMGYLKISLMILGFVVAGYAALRVGLLRRRAFLLLAVVVAVAFALTSREVSLPAHREGLAPLDFLRSFVPPAWWPLFPLVHLFWSLIYVGLRMRAKGISTIGELRIALSEGRILDAEVVTVLALVGLAPGLLLHIDGGSAFYFSDVQRWLSVGLLLAGGSALIFRARAPRQDVSLRRAALAMLAIPLAISMAMNATFWMRQMLRANAATRNALYPAGARITSGSTIRDLPSLGDATLLRAGLQSARNQNALSELRRLADLPRADRRRTALFIPQNESAYWGILARPGACTFAGHVAPALAAMAMIDGMPAVGCKLSRYYGLSGYAPRLRPQTLQDMMPSVLCAKARRYGLDRVLTLRFDVKGRSTRESTECSGTS